MEIPTDCPECGKQLSKTRKACACGWRIAFYAENKPESKQICNYITESGVCRKYGTISPNGLNGQYYCSDHWYAALNEKYDY